MKYEPPPFGPKDLYEDTFDPATMSSTSLSSTRSEWYRRPWFLVAVGVIAVVGISVISDLPTAMTPASDVAAQNAAISEINTDLAPCSYAVSEAFNFYTLYVQHRLTSSQYTQTLSLLKDDQAACGFTTNGLYDLTNNVQVDLTKAGKFVNASLAPLVTWMDSDSNGAIADIRLILTHHTVSTATADLARQEKFLSSDRNTVLSDISQANIILDGRVHPIKVPALPPLPGIA
jgi:hypothetical protein